MCVHVEYSCSQINNFKAPNQKRDQKRDIWPISVNTFTQGECGWWSKKQVSNVRINELSHKMLRPTHMRYKPTDAIRYTHHWSDVPFYKIVFYSGKTILIYTFRFFIICFYLGDKEGFEHILSHTSVCDN